MERANDGECAAVDCPSHLEPLLRTAPYPPPDPIRHAPQGNWAPDSDVDLLVEREREPEPEPERIRRLLGVAEMELAGLIGGGRVDLYTPGNLSAHFRDEVVGTAEVRIPRTTVVAAFPAFLERPVGAGNVEEILMGLDSMKSACEGSLGRDDDLKASGAASRAGPHLSPNGWTNRSPRGARISPATDSSGLRLWS